MNKNLIYTSFFLLLLIAFSYFTPVAEVSKIDKRPQILSTTVMIDSLVREIAQEKWVATLLMEGEIDPHSYQMRKGDKEKMEEAVIIFANGLSLEHNPSLYYHLTTKDSIFLGDRLLENHPESIISNDGEIDPHMWMDLEIMQQLCDMICTEITAIDKENAAFYRKNTNQLKAKMSLLDKKIITMMEQVPEENLYLVSSHDAFNYFVRRYFIGDSKQRLFSMQGLSTEAEISLKRMSQVIDFIKEHHISTVFFESNLPKDSILKVMEICKSFGVEVKISTDPLYGDTLGGMTYLEMMEHDAQVIAKNLKKGSEHG
ncbi:MAG: Manganese-binding lipoprotein MntA [Chlamydiia bacterium]|nr:Manganese-binding lipoprotein MntA [Chlamydiia bacterium]MCH9618682.1 Manganese-binding lipoprotein MntA [Chlamydiia bacterium]MCH9624415.1 Manganese-binding lipoprotein MntA [Chlamydiia bacterium]